MLERVVNVVYVYLDSDLLSQMSEVVLACAEVVFTDLAFDGQRRREVFGNGESTVSHTISADSRHAAV